VPLNITHEGPSIKKTALHSSAGLANGAKFGKHCQKSLSSIKLAKIFGDFFMPDICHFLKYQLSVLTKQFILNNLSKT